MKKSVSLILVILIVQSCNVLKVKKGGSKIPGIPFYGHKEIINQKTRYLFDWLEVSLKREVKDGESIVTTSMFNGYISSDYDVNLINNKLDLLTIGKITEADINTYLKSIPSVDFNNMSSLVLIDNNWKKVLAVDYDTVMYLNAKMPWFGSSSLTQKINANGTLAESTASTDSQIDELVTSAAGLAAPFLSFKAEKLKLDAVTQDSINKKNSMQLKDLMEKIDNNTSYKLEIKQKGFIYTLTKELAKDDIADANTPLSLDINKGNYTRTDWTGSSNSPQKKSDKPTIGISGSIVLPEKK